MKNEKEDEYSLFGGNVAAELRKMDTNQQIHAENLISQILYKGQLNKLSEYSIITENNMSGGGTSLYNYQNYISTPCTARYTSTPQPSPASSVDNVTTYFHKFQ